MISIFVTSRADNNQNSNIEQLVASLKEKSAKLSNFELLVKYDHDDPGKDEKIAFLKNSGLNVKIHIGDRGRGYDDIHLGYQSLIKLAAKDSLLFTCFADDFTLELEHWDEYVLNLVRRINNPFFILHQRHHPPTNRVFFNKSAYYMHCNLRELDSLHIIDEAPMWSSQLIRTIDCFGDVAFTDAWTIYIEQLFADLYNLNMTYFTKKNIISRELNAETDGEKSLRWHTSRKKNFQYISSDAFYEICKNEVDAVVSKVKRKPLRFYKFKCRYYFCSMRNAIQRIKSKFLSRFFKYLSVNYIANGEPVLLFSAIKHNIIVCRHRAYLAPHGIAVDFNHKNFRQQYKGVVVDSSHLIFLYLVFIFRAGKVSKKLFVESMSGRRLWGSLNKIVLKLKKIFFI